MHLVYQPDPATPCLFLWGNGARRLPALERLASLGRRATVPLVTDRLSVVRVRGSAIPLLDGVAVLAALDARDLERVSASVATWSLAAKLALDLIARERVVPLVCRDHGGAKAQWGVSLSFPQDAERFSRLARALPPAAHAVPVEDGASPPTARKRQGIRVWAPEALLTEFLDAVADALLRRAASQIPQRGERGGWEARVVKALTGPDPTFAADGFLERALPDELREWAASARGALATEGARLCLKLDSPADGRRPWTLGYFLQALDDPSLLLPAGRVWTTEGERLRWMDRTFLAPQEHLLKGLAQAGRFFPPIERSLDAQRPESVPLTEDEAWRLLSDAAPLLVESGFTLLLPAELTTAGQRRLRLRMRIGVPASGVAGAVTTDGRLSLESLLGYRWEVALGDHALSPKEFKELAALKRPLVRWRGQWVVLDPAEIGEITRLLQKAQGGTLPTREALAAVLEGALPREDAGIPTEVVPDGPLAGLLERLRAGAQPLPPPADFAGTLRHYQERGLAWLSLMAELGLGGCLADDMGLGKTIQLIAFLLARRAARSRDGRPALIVCPTSVLGNWERELARFAPTLPVLRHHGPERARSVDALREAPPHAVVVTTYGLLRRDASLLGEINWAVTTLDEAQNIKNAASGQARTARALRADHRFALTGTPVENRLAELWSILDFCVPGVLGPLERFRRRFAIPVERYRDDRAAADLRRLVGPFILRRTKSDPAILPDLPPKQEMSVVCTLSREQATLYQAVVEETMERIEAAEGIQRRGLVLALLTALKQVCNHPAHYLREPGPLPGRSGKLDRLTEMLEETVGTGDRALVFTQFREMGDRLVPHLERALETEVLFLHGGVPRTTRDAMVRSFQEDTPGPPIFVLSLKAGGTGLNLTRATRVFHFDRWWNPAVEDQATDRAHRIGQRRVVQVYRLLTAGTVEEKIDALLADKRALADRIVGAGEAWVTELSDSELRRLLTLSQDAVVEDDDNEAERPARAGSPRRRR
jgi:hypothetical protein